MGLFPDGPHDFAVQKGTVDVLLGSDNLEFHPVIWEERCRLTLSRSRIGEKRMMIAGRVDKSCLWLSRLPSPEPGPKPEPEPKKPEQGQPVKLYPDIQSEAGAELGSGSPTRGRSRSPKLSLKLGMLPLMCLMLCCQGVCGFKAYDCQNENVSTTAYSL